ncbi:MAG: peptide deformylase [Oscillospiraceae bacterium]
MAIRTIITDRDPILRKKSREVTNFDKRLHELLDDLSDTMYSANGVGLAAPQVSVLRRVAVVDTGDGLIEMVNPKIVYESAETIEDSEGCLSSPGEYAIIKRAKKVVVQYKDRDGNPRESIGEALLARAIRHECDHLDGIIFKDYADTILRDEDEQ